MIESDEGWICEGCGERVTQSLVSFCDFYPEGIDRPMIEINDTFLHMHHLALVPKGHLTVRWAVRRLVTRTFLRSRYRMGQGLSVRDHRTSPRAAP